jgi:hypothetical protein
MLIVGSTGPETARARLISGVEARSPRMLGLVRIITGLRRGAARWVIRKVHALVSDRRWRASALRPQGRTVLSCIAPSTQSALDACACRRLRVQMPPQSLAEIPGPPAIKGLPARSDIAIVRLRAKTCCRGSAHRINREEGFGHNPSSDTTPA